MNKKFFIWLIGFFILEFGFAKLGLQVKRFYQWDYNYFLPIIFICLTLTAVKWELIAKEPLKIALTAISFIICVKIIYNGLPNTLILNNNLIWQIFPSFFEEIIFRGILLKNLAEIEENIKFLSFSKFPFVSILIVSAIFATLHPQSFAATFDMSVYFSLIFLVTRSYWACGVEHFLQNIYGNLWISS